MYSFASDEYIEQLVKTHSDSMLRAAYALLKNRDDAEDAVQEAFMKLMEKEPHFKDSEHAKAWLLRVTINLSKNMLKSQSRKNKSETETEASYTEKESDGVLYCVMKLEENYRAVIHLYYYEGYSIKEIASILGLPSATVGTRLKRGRAKLKKMLEGDVSI